MEGIETPQQQIYASWVYQPDQFWDHQEIQDEFNGKPAPPTEPPQEISVALKGPDCTTKSIVLKATESAFQTQSFTLQYQQIRYVTTNCRALCTEDDRFVIMVSTRHKRGIVNEIEIGNMYILPESAAHALAVLNFFQYHIFTYLRSVTKAEDPSVIQQFIRPMIIQELDMKVYRRKEKKTFDEKRIAVLDQECFALYTKPYQESPDDKMFFWKEYWENSCVKVSKIKSVDVVLFQSQHLYVVIDCKQDGKEDTKVLEKAISVSVKPKPKKAFEDASTLLQNLCGQEVMDYEEPDYPPPPIPEDEIIELQPEGEKILDKFECEVTAGLESEEKQWQTVWDNQKHRLEQELMKPSPWSLPNINVEKWDFNNVDHLMKSLCCVEDELFRQVNYSSALATTVALKRFFIKSRVIRIRALMERSPMEILKNMFARGSVSSRNPPGAEVAGVQRGKSSAKEFLIEDDSVDDGDAVEPADDIDCIGDDDDE